MRKDFEDFLVSTKKALTYGALKTKKPLSDLDIAVQYAIGLIGDREGYPMDITPEKLSDEIQMFAPELLESEEEKAEIPVNVS